jgi:tRNA-2-methylthio-N6-dimethylallyladenosine synthase
LREIITVNQRHFFIQTFGCQMNDHDSATLAGLLASAGHVEVGDADEADLILVNTCAIREKAEQKVYSQLGRYKLLKERKPGIIVGVGGCMAQGEGRRVLSRAPYVDIVFGTQTLHRIADMVREVEKRRRRLVWVEMDHDPSAMEILYAHSRAEGIKAFITVMQGCDNYCAYCIVPHVRGREISRPGGEIVAEAERLAALGAREVTLLGQNVNSYGLKGGDGTDFPGLIRRVAAVGGIDRIRFTTSHPKDLGEELIRLFAEEPKLMPHIHLPLQSGSDRVLEAMNRRYTAAHYLGLVAKLREAVPRIAITSDMIVGFPGETEEDFAATMRVMDEVVFDNLFSFKFSPRRGTRAAAMEERLPDAVKEERLSRLQERQTAYSLGRNRMWIGAVRPVLVEGASKAGGVQFTGRTPENKIVNFPGAPEGIGRIMDVTVTDAFLHSLVGEKAEDAR